MSKVTITLVFLVFTELMIFSSAAPKYNEHIIKIPDECDKHGFCAVRPEGYDAIEEKINKLLPSVIGNFADRIGQSHSTSGVELDEDNCPSQTSTQSVYTYRNENSTDVDILVQTKLFPQLINEIKCVNQYTTKNGKTELKRDDQQCFQRLGMNSFLKFNCKQIRSKRSLLVFDPKLDKIVYKYYNIDVCCSCQITNH